MDILQIVFRRAEHLDEAAGAVRSDTIGGHINLVIPPQILRRKRLFVGLNLGQRTGSDHLAPVRPGARPHVDHVIRAPDGLLVVLDHQHRVAQVAQALECLKQLLVVAGVQADAWLVENVQHTNQPGTDLRGQPDPLRLPSAECAARAIERQVAQPNVLQKTQSRANLINDIHRNFSAQLIEL